jgi:hypothetical protein
MLTEFLNRLLELNQPPIIEVEGRPYSTVAIREVRRPLPTMLNFNTLTGLVDYLQKGIDGTGFDKPFVHVQNEGTVLVMTNLQSPYMDRAHLAAAIAPKLEFPFGNWMDREMFTIALQAMFVQSPGCANLLAMIGTLTAEDVRTSKDDGITQTAAARKGIMLAERVTVPNPISLVPFRTFREIQQPESKFVFRIRESGSRAGGMELALFEADGGTWKLTAIELIAKYLRKVLGDSYTVLA